MATIKANGGAVAQFKGNSGATYTVCKNGQVLRKFSHAGATYKRLHGMEGHTVETAVAWFEKRSAFVRCDNAATISRSQTDAHYHERAKEYRRLRRGLR